MLKTHKPSGTFLVFVFENSYRIVVFRYFFSLVQSFYCFYVPALGTLHILNLRFDSARYEQREQVVSQVILLDVALVKLEHAPALTARHHSVVFATRYYFHSFPPPHFRFKFTTCFSTCQHLFLRQRANFFATTSFANKKVGCRPTLRRNYLLLRLLLLL